MRLTGIVAGCGAILATVAGAAAAPAAPTADQAAALKATLQHYVGQGTAGTGPVTVTPNADGYAIAVDLKAALQALDGLGFELEPATYSFEAAETDAGLWHVSHLVVPKLTVKHGGQSYSVVVNGPAFDGLYDPRIPAFQSSLLTYDSLSVAAVGVRSETQTREIDHGRQVSMATPTGDGTANVQLSQSSDGFVQDIDADAVGAPAGSSGTFALTSRSTSGDIAIEDLHSRALADLWAFLVAHPDEVALKAAQDDLRSILRRALPLFDRLTQSGEARGLTVKSPYGTFAADAFGGRVKVSGLTADGALGSELHVAGLTIPPGLVPSWAEGLVPTSASVAEEFRGFHLAAAAQQAVDSFDLGAKDPLSPGVLDSMKASLGPLDQMVVTLAPSHMVSRLVTVDYDGAVHLTSTVPTFQVNIKASGLDAALQDLQTKGAGDPSASQVSAVLVLAKGLGKADTDGRLSWAVVRDAAGHVTVNGLTLPGSGAN